MKKISSLMSLLMILFIGMSAQCKSDDLGEPDKTKKLIRLAGIDWRPYEGQSLANGGVATEIVVSAFENQGYLVEITYIPWSRLLKELEYGHFDAAISAYYTPDRAQEYYFSNAYMQSPVVFYKRTGESYPWPELNNLKPYKIGVVRGYSNGVDFDQADFLDLDFANSDLANIKKLLAQHVDLIVIDKHTASYILRQDMKAFINDLEPMTPPLIIHQLHTMFSKKVKQSQQKVKDFNAGLAAIQLDQTLNKILAKHGFE